MDIMEILQWAAIGATGGIGASWHWFDRRQIYKKSGELQWQVAEDIAKNTHGEVTRLSMQIRDHIQGHSPHGGR